MGIVAAAKALSDAFALRACSVTTAWLLSLIFALMAVPHYQRITRMSADDGTPRETMRLPIPGHKSLFHRAIQDVLGQPPTRWTMRVVPPRRNRTSRAHHYE